jgi:type IV pilus assembly protein PilW
MRSSYLTTHQLKHRGFTLVEVMVAMVIALFLLGGLMTMVSSTRNVFGQQNQLTLLQDSERMAMTVIGDIVQQAGYFPNPVGVAGHTAADVPRPMSGTTNAAAPGDTFSMQYMTTSGDGILNCSGVSNVSGADHYYTNTFSVNAFGQLVCNVSVDGGAGTDYPLVNGIQNMSALYGVNTNSNCSNCVDTYLDGTTVTNTGRWPNVLSVLITLTFNNPLYSASAAASGDKQPQTITVSRVIAVMGRSGVAQ